MIIVDRVHKRYRTAHGPGKWVLRDVSLVIPPNVNVGLVGANGAGKSTLLRLIGGVDEPTRGTVERRCRVSWPMGFSGGLQRMLTGRQNAKFVCRIHGHEGAIRQHIEFIENFAELGEAFDEPVGTYSSGMQARLKFALSLAFDFDVYISDELTAVGDTAFKKKAKEAFRALSGRASLIMVSHQEGTLRDFCSAGILLQDGKTHWFDDIEDALAAYEGGGESDVEGSMPGDSRAVQAVATRIKQQRKLLSILDRGLSGEPSLVGHRPGKRLVAEAEQLGLTLLAVDEIEAQGYRLMNDAVPILRKHQPDQASPPVDLYDLHSQCIQGDASKDEQ